MTVLVLTRSDDHPGVAGVLRRLEQGGARAVRFDTDRFPAEPPLRIEHGPGGRRVTADIGGHPLDLADVTAVWYRRTHVGAGLPSGLDPQLRRAAVQESLAMVRGLLTGLNAFHLDFLPDVRRAESKILQLKLAEEAGLATPRTLITNDPAAARRFAEACSGQLVGKTLTSFSIREGASERVVFTSRIKPGDLAHLEELRLGPMILQEYLDKAEELRVTAVGPHLFTAGLDARGAPCGQDDWRRSASELAGQWRPAALPHETAQQIQRLLHALRLNYAAIDLIRTPAGELLFLEANPAGEYYWLEQTLGLPISQAIADLLISRSQAPRC